VRVTRFDATSDLIIVSARVGDRPGTGEGRVRLAIDTGSSETVIRPEVIDDLGYSPRDGEAITTVRAALGKEHGYTLRITRFAALGYAASDFRVHVFDLAEGFGIDGLIGLSFLRRFNYTIRSAEGRLLAEPIIG
jgi:predicted aspartyl protease